MSDSDPTLPCPCDRVEHPRPIASSPGRDALARRVGDFTSFRRALLTPSPGDDAPGDAARGEDALAAWRPNAEGDLALQMVEWFAYLADVLTFYDERIANESYLGTAVLPENVRALVATLGYRPRPGIGAEGIVAGLLTGVTSVTLPAGFALQSKPGPGEKPQIFELDAPTSIAPPSTTDADPPADEALSGRVDLLLVGNVTSVKVDDLLVLLRAGWHGGARWAALRVTSVATEKDPRGAQMTRVGFTLESDPLPDSASTSDYRLFRPTQLAHPWLYLPKDDVVGPHRTHLESTARALRPGAAVLFEIAGTEDRTALVQVSEYSEEIWYANADDPEQPAKPPLDAPGLAILHSKITYEKNLALDSVEASTVSIHHGFVEVAPLRGEPALTLEPSTTRLSAGPGATFPIGREQRVLVEDARSTGALGWLSTDDGVTATLRWEDGAAFSLTPPLRVHFGLLEVSRGQTVQGEVLGSGDPTRANQEFTLTRSPLTYLSSTDPEDPGYRSTLTLFVSGIAWREARSFYGQAADARVFVLYEDDAQQTHVRFGDGVHGARLPAGTSNVVANYRYGSGASAPAAGALTNVLKPVSGLGGVRSPVAPAGGDDPETASSLSRLAPRSVLTFGRAVSADDYGTLAAQAPGVKRARTVFEWDVARQRSLIKVYVGDDAAAVTSARSWLRAYSDPNRLPVVEAARAKHLSLSLTLQVSSSYDPNSVAQAVRDVLLDPDAGLFAASSLSIGGLIFDSQIYAACLAVEGTVAVHGLVFDDGTKRPGPRRDPGAGGFYQLLAQDLSVSAEPSPNA